MRRSDFFGLSANVFLAAILVLGGNHWTLLGFGLAYAVISVVFEIKESRQRRCRAAEGGR